MGDVGIGRGGGWGVGGRYVDLVSDVIHAIWAKSVMRWVSQWKFHGRLVCLVAVGKKLT